MEAVEPTAGTGATQFLHQQRDPPPPPPTATASASTPPEAPPSEYRRRYHGLIKREPGDFEVREIDLYGRVADITRPATLPTPPPPQQQEQRQQEQRAPEPEPTTPPAAPAFNAPIPPVEELLAPEHVSALAALQSRAEAAIAAAEPAATDAEAGHLHAASVVLPLPEDKDARGRLHRAVRARCPCLRTAQEAVEGQPGGALHLVVRVDEAGVGVHRRLRPLLPDPAQSLALYAFVARGRADEGAPAGVVLGPMASKESRKALYNLVHSTFPQLRMTTREGEGGPTVLLEWRDREPRRGAKRRRGEGAGEAAGPQGVHRFVLRKEDTEHLDALTRLARALRVPLNALAHAGVKDRRAVTYQFITASRLPPDRVAGVADLRIPGLELGNLEANWQRPLQPGDNQGNAFRLRVRGVRPATVAAGDVEGHDASSSSWRAELEGRLGQVKAGGFLNYFGPQRLSAAHRGAGPEGLPAAWEVGRALLRKDWEGVTRLLLGPREGDDARLREAKAKFWDGSEGPKRLLKHWPRALGRERCFLKGLAVRGQDNVAKALLFVPHHVRAQWANAYQAYLWNRAASEHIRHYGCRAVEGDLVLLPPPASDPTPTEPPDGSGKGKGTGASGGKPRVRALEQAEVEGAKGEELIYEVVLPLPGPGVEMPGHRIGEFYKQMLEADGLWDLLGQRKAAAATATAAPKDPDAVVTVTGAYRRLVARPQGLEWTIAAAVEDDDDNDHGLTLDLSFRQGSGEYATTLVREVLGGESETYLPPWGGGGGEEGEGSNSGDGE